MKRSASAGPRGGGKRVGRRTIHSAVGRRARGSLLGLHRQLGRSDEFCSLRCRTAAGGGGALFTVAAPRLLVATRLSPARCRAGAVECRLPVELRSLANTEVARPAGEERTFAAQSRQRNEDSGQGKQTSGGETMGLAESHMMAPCCPLSFVVWLVSVVPSSSACEGQTCTDSLKAGGAEETGGLGERAKQRPRVSPSVPASKRAWAATATHSGTS